MKSYKFLKTISWLFKAVAIITLLVGVLYSASIISDMFPFFWAVFYTTITFLVLMGIGGILEIAIDIALDTKETHQNALKVSSPNQRDEALIQWLRANPNMSINDYYSGVA